jgi:hypothetical protein
MPDPMEIPEVHQTLGHAINAQAESVLSMALLLAHEVQAVKALHAVIPHSGQEPRSEALEHLLEHVIMRKQEQVDFLWHATSATDPLQRMRTDAGAARNYWRARALPALIFIERVSTA